LDGENSELFLGGLRKSLVVVACFLPGRANDLSAPQYNKKRTYIRLIKKEIEIFTAALVVRNLETYELAPLIMGYITSTILNFRDNNLTRL
jgi:hypothetical protein